VGYGAALLALGSLVFGIVGLYYNWPTLRGTSKELTGSGEVKAFILAFWIVVPPFWFWLEFFGHYRYERSDLEQFKYGQDVSSKIWLALVTALTLLYFGKDLRG
jgi:hypothetical protein